MSLMQVHIVIEDVILSKEILRLEFSDLQASQFHFHVPQNKKNHLKIYTELSNKQTHFLGIETPNFSKEG